MSLDDHRNPSGTYNGVNALAELTGVPVDDIRAIAEQVKANSAKLNGCAYHDFERIPRPEDTVPQARLGDRWRCVHCEGEIDAIAHNWHEQGRRLKPFQSAKPYSFTPVPGATCTQVLKDTGATSWPRTCQVHGLACGVKKP